MFDKPPLSTWKIICRTIEIIVGIGILIFLVRLFDIGLGTFLNIKL